MTKDKDAKAYFHDVLWYWLPEMKATKPKHIKFSVKTGSPDIETCDIRLTSIDSESDSAPDDYKQKPK